MIEQLWLLCVVSCGLVSLAHWRTGLYLAVAIDAARDPVRKLAEGQPVVITLAGTAIWGFLILGALSRNQREVLEIFTRYPRLRTMLILIACAIGPAACISCISFPGGWKLAVIGACSYLVPLIGIGLGFAFLRTERELLSLMAFYVLVNGIALVGAPLEYFDVPSRALGGLNDALWIRYRTGYTVDLISGFYRSPDIMGLHAAHVVMFSAILAVRSRGTSWLFWASFATWGGYCLLLAGRRKMIGMPLVFVVAFLLFSRHRSKAWFGQAVVLTLSGGAMLAGAWTLTVDTSQYDEYVTYAGSLFTEGAQRANTLIYQSSVGTLQQVGVFGAGLGTATQGRYYAGVSTSRSTRGWQEDGASRMLMEFGVPGVLLLGYAGLCLLHSVIAGSRLTRRSAGVSQLQVGLGALALANLASFVISHQQFSGSPTNSLLAVMYVGFLLACPRLTLTAPDALPVRPAQRTRTPLHGPREKRNLVRGLASSPR